MIRYHITKACTLARHSGGIGAQERAALSQHLPKAAIRRFSDSGLEVSALLHELAPGTDEPLIYVSTFAESRSLEEFIDGFPVPSPARFQRSIHPGAVQQACVVDAAPIRTFIPIAGQDGISIVAVRAALTLGAPSAILAGAEECGTWSVAIHAGSETGFAFALRLERAPSAGTESLGTLSWASEGAAGTDASLSALHAAIAARTPLTMSHPDIGSITLCWK
jgi:hypothetical protein